MPREPRPSRPAEVRRDLFGGRGDVHVTNLLAERAEPFAAALACALAPSGSVGAHVQEEFAELLLGIAGEGLANVAGHDRALCAGDCVYVPLGSVLTIENCSDETTLHYLIVKARAPISATE